MKTIFTLLIFIVCGIIADAQTPTRPRNVGGSTVQIVLPDTARYEIISMANGSIIRLDRYTGKSYSFYITGKRKWYLIDVNGGLPATTDQTPKYQIFDEQGNFFLFNNETGQLWIFTNRSWEPVVD